VVLAALGEAAQAGVADEPVWARAELARSYVVPSPLGFDATHGFSSDHHPFDCLLERACGQRRRVGTPRPFIQVVLQRT
jgi:hypothetical protein